MIILNDDFNGPVVALGLVFSFNKTGKMTHLRAYTQVIRQVSRPDDNGLSIFEVFVTKQGDSVAGEVNRLMARVVVDVRVVEDLPTPTY